MNNIRKIIEERFENAQNAYHRCYNDVDFPLHLADGIRGQIEAYQDCLNLMQPRTETDILNDFEKLGYQIPVNNEKELSIGFQTVNGWFGINIYKYAKSYEVYEIINAIRYSVSLGIKEHKLLNELFICWGWL
jgi:hypothetical protein